MSEIKLCEECKEKPVTGAMYWSRYCGTSCRDKANYKRVKARRKLKAAAVLGLLFVGFYCRSSLEIKECVEDNQVVEGTFSWVA